MKSNTEGGELVQKNCGDQFEIIFIDNPQPTQYVKEKGLSLHNKYRIQHVLEPLEWD